MSEAFPKEERLRSNEEFQRLLNQGWRYSCPGLQLVIAPGSREGRSRAGFIVKRRLGRAVLRNLMKRRMREAYRQLKSEVRPGMEMVISATAVMDFETLRTRMAKLLEKAGARNEQKR